VFEQIKTQEQTKQAELRAKEAEFKVQAEQAAIVSAGGAPLLAACRAGLLHFASFCIVAARNRC